MRACNKENLGRFIPMCVIELLAFQTRGYCQDSRVEAISRFKQVQEFIGNTDGNPNLITEVEFRSFLAGQKEAIVKRYKDSGLTFLDPEFDALLDRLAKRLVGWQITGRGGIDAESLPRAEAAILDPLNIRFGSLLPARPSEKKSESLLDAIDHWVNIRKSFLDSKGIGSPALFSWTQYGGNDDSVLAGQHHTVYDIEAALVFEPSALEVPDPLGIPGSLTPVGAVEANINTQSKSGKNLVTHRLGAEWFVYGGTPDRVSHNVTMTGDFITDRHYDAKIYGATAQYTPDYVALAIGQYTEIGESAAYMRWRPYVGLAYGDVADDGGISAFQKMSNYLDAYFKVTTELLCLERVKVVPELTGTYELRNGHDWHWLFAVGVRYSLDDKDRITLELNYKNGESGPDFADVASLTVGLGLKL